MTLYLVCARLETGAAVDSIHFETAVHEKRMYLPKRK
jgi:hypothetical protein